MKPKANESVDYKLIRADLIQLATGVVYHFFLSFCLSVCLSVCLPFLLSFFLSFFSLLFLSRHKACPVDEPGSQSVHNNFVISFCLATDLLMMSATTTRSVRLSLGSGRHQFDFPWALVDMWSPLTSLATDLI